MNNQSQAPSSMGRTSSPAGWYSDYDVQACYVDLKDAVDAFLSYSANPVEAISVAVRVALEAESLSEYNKDSIKTLLHVAAFLYEIRHRREELEYFIRLAEQEGGPNA
jgi:hypothetical protein